MIRISTIWVSKMCSDCRDVWVFVWEQGWCSGKSTRLPPMWPGFDSRSRRHMWVEFVVGSRPCSEGFFSGYSGFPLSTKTNISKFQFDLEKVDGRATPWNPLKFKLRTDL